MLILSWVSFEKLQLWDLKEAKFHHCYNKVYKLAFLSNLPSKLGGWNSDMLISEQSSDTL